MANYKLSVSEIYTILNGDHLVTEKDWKRWSLTKDYNLTSLLEIKDFLEKHLLILNVSYQGVPDSYETNQYPLMTKLPKIEVFYYDENDVCVIWHDLKELREYISDRLG